MTGPLRRAAGPTALALVWTVHVTLLVLLSGRFGGAALTFALCCGTLAAASAARLRDRSHIRDMSRRDTGMAALAGVAGVFLAPYLVVSHRYTDAPPGTEVVLLAGVAWGLGLLVAGAVALWREGRPRAAGSAGAGALAILAGSAGVLGNWERPSSFSPFVRFVAEEAWMVVAGIVFAASVALLARLARRYGPGRPAFVAAGAATAVAALAVALSAEGLAGLSRLAEEGSAVALWAAAWAVAWVLLPRLAAERGAVRVGAVLTLPPILLPALSVAERLGDIRGPSPTIWAGVAGGTLLVVAGVACVLRAEGAPPQPSARRLLLRWWALVVGLAATAALTMPALQASVSAVRESGAVEMSWAMPGWESVAGWAALALGGLLAASAASGSWWSDLAALAAVAAYPLLSSTPLHVLTRGLSFDIQQDYGTPYASITFREVPSWPARAAVVGTAIGLAVLLSGDLFAAVRAHLRTGRT